jgi:hypothetical protein
MEMKPDGTALVEGYAIMSPEIAIALTGFMARVASRQSISCKSYVRLIVIVVQFCIVCLIVCKNQKN